MIQALKERMVGFLDDLSQSQSVRTEIKADTHLSNTYFRAVVPAVLLGLSMAFNPAVAQAEPYAPLSETPEYKAFLNGYEQPPLVTMQQAAKNLEQAKEKYGDVFDYHLPLTPENAQLEITRHLAMCELVYGDTHHQGARDYAQTYAELIGAIPSESKQVDLFEAFRMYCVYGKGAEQDAINAMDEIEQAVTYQAPMSFVPDEAYMQLIMQNQMMGNQLVAPRIINDDGDVISRGELGELEALTHDVRGRSKRSKNRARDIGGWASAAFGVAEGIAGVVGSREGANMARQGGSMAQKGTRYGERVQSASRQSGVDSARSFGNIVRDIGRDMLRNQTYSQNRY